MEELYSLQQKLNTHPVYGTLTNLKSLRHFMSYHVFAVWDFMSLLKSLQREITCVQVPWRPSPYPACMVRLINQIVVGEESDVDQNGRPVSHFELYLRSMEEVGASTQPIRKFLSDYTMPEGVREFVTHNLKVAETGHVVEVAASFFFGREKLIPCMFESIVKVLERERIEAPTLIYYLKRHIELDGGEHGPLALECLEMLTKDNPGLKDRARRSGIKALELRARLWDNVLGV